MKKISIIIPCYNVEQYISQCLYSVINQTYSYLEVICINDGSNDNTLSLLEDFAKKDSRINILNQQNIGLSATRNVGVERSTGEYIMFVDADDWLENGAIETCIEFLPSDLICFSYNRIFKTIVQPRKLNLNGIYVAEFVQRRIVGLIDAELADPSQADSLVTVWGKLYKTEFIKNYNVEFTETALIGNEDALFNIQYLENIKTVALIEKLLYNYRKTNKMSFTSLYKPQLFEKWKNLYEIISKIIANKPDEFKTAFENRVCLSMIGLGLNETFSPKSYAEQKKRLKEILSDPLYTKAFANLNMNYFQMHWKLFFMFAKRKQVGFLHLMLLIIKAKISK
jgi:glycosyltransferase EpsH